MSFDVFVSCHCNGKPAGIPRQQVVEAFGGALRFVEPERWEVEYNSTTACELYVSLDAAGPEKVTSLMVSRPCADLRLWDSLFAMMRLGNVVLYYPGCSAAIVATEEAIRHLPDGMVEAFGGAACIHSGQEIADRIRSGR